MSSVTDLMRTHHSVRSYKSDPIDPSVLDQILEAGRASPSSINGQQVSLVVTQDLAKRQKIAELASIGEFGQPWIAQAAVFITLVIDFHKTKAGMAKTGKKHVIETSLEGFGVGAVDAGIILGNLMTAARSFGLGVVPIGGIRANPQEMIDLLGLPQDTFPIVGLCIGHIKQDSTVKPRLPKETFIHHEKYDSSRFPELIDRYNTELVEHWKKIGRTDGVSWSESISQYYQSIYFPKVWPVAKKQGFTFEG